MLLEPFQRTHPLERRTPAESPTVTARPTNPRISLRILHTSDVHANLRGYDYFADRADTAHGLTRAATLIARERAAARNCLLFDTGDFLQGTPLADVAAHPHRQAQISDHPVIRAMNAMGYDAAALGNHDFNFGLPVLHRALSGARFPVLCANLADVTEANAPVFAPHHMLCREVHDENGHAHRLKIGLFGVLPPQVVAWDKRHLHGRVTACDILGAARSSAEKLRRAGADLIIALSHSGIGNEAARDDMENAAVPLAALDGIDVVLAGHTHLVFPGPHHAATAFVDPGAGLLHGKPATMPGHSASHVGRIDLALEPQARTWRIAERTVAALPVRPADLPTTPEDRDLVRVLEDDHDATLSYIRQPVGRIDRPVHSYFALFGKDPSLRIVAEAQRRFVTDALADGPLRDLPVLAATSPLKSGGHGGPDHYTDVAAGDVSMAAVADMAFFPNEIAALEVTGAQVSDWLEMSAGVFNTIQPRQQDQALHNPAIASYNFDVVHGLTYRIDLSQPPRFDRFGQLINPGARRILDLSHAGKPLDPDQRFILASNSFRVGGGGHFPGLADMRQVLPLPRRTRDVLAMHIHRGESLFGSDETVWSFAPMPATSVLAETGPRARAHLHALSGGPVAPIGVLSDGFLWLRLDL